MENRSVTEQETFEMSQLATCELANERMLSNADVLSLVQFFQLLDRWDREAVQ